VHAQSVFLNIRTLFFSKFLHVKKFTKETCKKIILSIFWLRRTQSLTHTVVYPSVQVSMVIKWSSLPDWSLRRRRGGRGRCCCGTKSRRRPGLPPFRCRRGPGSCPRSSGRASGRPDKGQLHHGGQQPDPDDFTNNFTIETWRLACFKNITAFCVKRQRSSLLAMWNLQQKLLLSCLENLGVYFNITKRSSLLALTENLFVTSIPDRTSGHLGAVQDCWLEWP